MAAAPLLDAAALWARYAATTCHAPSIGLTLDISRMRFADGFFEEHAAAMTSALAAMTKLEAGAIANPDENRMVGHYWLRNPDMAPTPEIAKDLRDDLAQIKDFASRVHTGTVAPAAGGRFTDVLVIGIGGSALGPQFVADALGEPTDPMRVHFIDNTDPDGIDRTLRSLGEQLATTLSVVISKSGGTPETRNGMLAAKAAYEAKGMDFAKHAVAITGVGSKLDKTAEGDGWLERFRMYDWVGGRTSELATVGLVPAALQGLDIDAMLRGAADCDAVTRVNDVSQNPAAILALMWLHATNGKGEKDMVVLPYRDRLLLFSRYLQQLVMESLGKETDLDGNTVHQGIAVYGNKGSTDQHAYVQQLREGVNNFFAVFIEILGAGKQDITVEEGVTAGDYLHGFLRGTRTALYENGRESMTITLDELGPRGVGILIALFERAVGFYASLVNINAYHQPGVEAGKKAAASVLELQKKVEAALTNEPQSAEAIAGSVGESGAVETVYHLLRHLSASGRVKAEDSGPTGRFAKA